MDSDYESDEENYAKEFETLRQGIIFLIDACQKMFEGVDEEGRCYLQRCIICIRDRMRYNIMVSDKEYIGIVLMGARANVASQAASSVSDNVPVGNDGVVKLFEVSRPGADILKTLHSDINSIENRPKVKSCSQTFKFTNDIF